jgi:uncharacterized protein YvpB
LVEHTTENCGVLGPIPSLGTKNSLKREFLFNNYGESIEFAFLSGHRLLLSTINGEQMTQKQIRISLGIVIFLLVFLAGVIAFMSLPAGGIARNISPTLMLTFTSTNTASPIPTNSPTPAPTPLVQITAAATSTPIVFPESFYITKITGHRQVYALGCEAADAVDWAGYFGTTIYEYDFQISLPHSDNPDYGFVGDVNSIWGQIPPYAYGVYSGPVADLLVSYGLPAQSVKDYTLDQVKQKLSESKPIIVWVIGNMEWSRTTDYTDSKGRITKVAPFEHVVILTGYDADSIRYMTNGRFYDTPTDVFLNSWGVLGNMAVIHE